MRKKTLREIKMGSGAIIPAGTELNLTLSRDAIRAEFNGKTFRFRYSTAKDNFGAPFTKTPTIGTLERWDSGGYAKTVTGKKTDPDGYCEKDGPSWLVAMGMI